MTDRYTHDGDCPHGRPRDETTARGMPKCPPCRKRAMYALRSKRIRPQQPALTQPTLINRPT